MFWWQEILTELEAAIRYTITYNPSSRNHSASTAAKQIRPAVSDMEQILNSTPSSNLANKSRSELLSIMSRRLTESSAALAQDTALRVRICERLEELVRSLFAELNSTGSGNSELVESFLRDTLARLDTHYDYLLAIWGYASETEIFNLVEQTIARTLAGVKRFASLAVTVNVDGVEWKRRMLASARVKYHRKSILSMSLARQESHLRRLLICVDNDRNRYGTLSYTHAGFLHKAHSEDFLRWAQSAISRYPGMLRLIAYVAGEEALSLLVDQLRVSATPQSQKACADALRIVGGEVVTSTFCTMLSSPAMQATVAEHLIDMACPAVLIPDSWFLEDYDPHQALQSLGELSYEPEPAVKRAVQKVLDAIEPLERNGEIPGDLAERLRQSVRGCLVDP
jgi:hypothetical protein